MGVRGVIKAAAAVLVSLVGAGSALAATGTVTIQVDLPKQSPLPASVLAYPLDPGQLTQMGWQNDSDPRVNLMT